MPSLDAAVNVLHLFGDPTRMRLMSLLAREELTVAELTTITDLAQSRVSTHLGKLREADVLRDRRVGASTVYSLNDATMPEAARRVWTLIQSDVLDPLVEADRQRCDALVRARATRQPWPDAVAGEMERHYSPGRTWESLARGFLGLMRLGDVLDVGCGDGAIAELLVERARSITCFDQNERMIEAARARLEKVAGSSKVNFAVGDAHEIPFGTESFDEVLLFNMLTQARTPAKVIEQAARVLRPQGRLAVVVLDGHAHGSFTTAYHHVHPGIGVTELGAMIEGAGLVIERCAVTSRERRQPNFQVISAFAHKC